MAQAAPTQEQVQAAIGRMRGVVANRVVLSGGDVMEIHVLADSQRPAKQIVRDIESLCAAEFGLRIDHRKVSVALIDPPKRSPKQRPRPEIKGFRVELSGARVAVSVMLGAGDRTYEGSSEGDAFNRNRVAAIAALRALERYLDESCRLALDDLVSFQLGGWDGFLAGVVLFSRFGEERLVGSALQRKDPLEAVIRAVLDALNRRIGTAGEGSESIP